MSVFTGLTSVSGNLIIIIILFFLLDEHNVFIHTFIKLWINCSISKKNIFLTFIYYMSVFTELTSVSGGLNVSLFFLERTVTQWCI